MFWGPAGAMRADLLAQAESRSGVRAFAHLDLLVVDPAAGRVDGDGHEDQEDE